MSAKKSGDRPPDTAHLLATHAMQLVPGRQVDFGDLQRPDWPQIRRRPPSVAFRHLDCGSCNGCELEIIALSGPVYDLEQYGISCEASPRHADVLFLTGPLTRNLVDAARRTLAAMPVARVLLLGDCAIDGGEFKDSYAVLPRPLPDLLRQAVVAEVPGCPPSPDEILSVLFQPDVLRALG